MNNLNSFSQIYLQNPIIWKLILLSFNICKNTISEKLNKNLFFDEIGQLKKMSEWKVNNTLIEGYWLEFFNFMKNEETPEIVYQFFFNLLGTSVLIERVFCKLINIGHLKNNNYMFQH